MKKVFIKIYIFLYAIIFILLAGLLCFGKRTLFSESERRKTLSLHDFKFDNVSKLNPGDFLEKVFVDTVPHRDEIIDSYIMIKKFKGFNSDVSIIDVNNKTGFNEDFNNAEALENDKAEENKEVENKEAENKDYDIVNVIDSTNKVVVVGKGKDVRGINVFAGYNENECEEIAININSFVDKLREHGINANVYYMLIPLACAYYLPDQLKNIHINQRDSILNIYSKIIGATCVNIYDILYNHKDEEIYLRTDSHWAQRGAYYAGMEFAKVANTNYGNIDNDYIEGTVLDYCSSYYRYTEDQRFVDCHETFYYYEPKIEYDTIQIFYDELEYSDSYAQRIVENAKFFNDSSRTSKSYAYGIYMGGDNNTTIVKINSNDTKRRLMIIKDSFGNALAPNLFYSFDEVHVIDFRHFKGNLIDYMKSNNITDVLLSSQISMARAECKSYNSLLRAK